MLHLLFVCLFTYGADHPTPFWKAKEKVYKRVQNREIIVSVKTVEPKEKTPAGKMPKNALAISGGGHVRAPYEFVYREALDFNDLARASSYIDSAKYDPEKQHLDLGISALGHKTEIKIALTTGGGEGHKHIGFNIIKGPMRGMHGRFLFTALSAQQSEVAIEGDYGYDEFPIPKVFLEFGMEVVFQRMAMHLRQHVEEEFKTQVEK